MKPYLMIMVMLAAASCVYSATPASCGEIHIEGGRVRVTTDDGKTIDTANLPSGSDVQIEEGEDVEINDNGVSIGSITNNGGEQKNVTRSTTLDNVTIIRDGKTTIYRKGAAAAKQGEGE